MSAHQVTQDAPSCIQIRTLTSRMRLLWIAHEPHKYFELHSFRSHERTKLWNLPRSVCDLRHMPVPTKQQSRAASSQTLGCLSMCHCQRNMVILCRLLCILLETWKNKYVIITVVRFPHITSVACYWSWLDHGNVWKLIKPGPKSSQRFVLSALRISGLKLRPGRRNPSTSSFV